MLYCTYNKYKYKAIKIRDFPKLSFVNVRTVQSPFNMFSHKNSSGYFTGSL